MLENYQIKPHPGKEIFAQLNISLGTVSKFLGLSYSYTSLLLTGNCKMPKKHEAKLNELIELVRKEREGNAIG